MRVSQIMSRTLETCRPDDTLATAAGKMWDRDVGCLPVVSSDGKVIAMITDRDVSMGAFTQGRAPHEIPVSTAMSKEIYACSADDSLTEAQAIMRTKKVRRLAVLDSSKQLVGIVSLNDLARESERESGQKGRAISSQEVSATLAAVCEPHGERQMKAVA